MRTLYLLRHAKSSWDEPGLADHERPLNSRGRKAAAAMGAHFGEAGVTPGLVLCSSARRTVETLEAVRKGLPDEAVVEIEDALYGASAGQLLERINSIDDDVGSVLLIAHNPGTEDLALALARPGAEVERMRVKFPTAALATLRAEGTWEDLEPGAAELAAFVKPRDLP